MDSPHFSDDRFISFDGASLGLSVWRPPENAAPDVVIIGVHGMNDYAGAFRWSAPYWAERGAIVYAYDQRGFGRSPRSGVWPAPDLLREDLRALTTAVREHHPDARLAIVGVSMGAAVAMTAFAEDPPPVDALILSGPGLRGWGSLPLSYRAALWTLSHTAPGLTVKPPKGLKIVPTDNQEVLLTHWKDRWFQKSNRVDSVHGVVSIMEAAHKAASALPPDVSTLLLYGGRDQIVPEKSVRRTTPRLPAHVRTAYYPAGYHMLLRDLGREKVLGDVLAFIRDPDAPAPSGAEELPWRVNETP